MATLPTYRKRLLPLVGAVACLFTSVSADALNVRRLDPGELDTLQAILHALEPVIAAKRQDGTANILSWDALYEPLAPARRAFVDEFRRLNARTLGATSHYFGEVTSEPALTAVGAQHVMKGGVGTPLDPQYLPLNVLRAYEQMMDAMQADLGKRLLVESGYRSPAYQLYLFLYYLPKHDYSIVETNRFVALPGHSEHGYPPRQAIDFINASGINGEDHPEEFEALPEFAWLQQHAKEHGFALSYPKDNPYHTAYEPWHWHYEAP